MYGDPVEVFMEIPNKLINYLNEKKVGYEILHHPEAFTVQTIAAAEHIKGRHHAKVVPVKSGGQHLMTVLPADHRADLQKLEKIDGEPASLGDGRGIRVAVSKLREGSDAAIWQPLRFA